MGSQSLTFEKLFEGYGFTMTPKQVSEVIGLTKDTILRMLQRKRF